MNQLDIDGNCIKDGARVQYLSDGLIDIIYGDIYIVKFNAKDEYIEIQSESTGKRYYILSTNCQIIPDDPIEFLGRIPV